MGTKLCVYTSPNGNLLANLSSPPTTYTPAHAYTQPPKNRIYVTHFTDALLLHCTSTSTAQHFSGHHHHPQHQHHHRRHRLQSIPREVCTASLVIVAYYDDVKRNSAGHASRVSAHNTTLPNPRLTPSPIPSTHTYTHSRRAVAAQLRAKFITSAHIISIQAHTQTPVQSAIFNKPSIAYHTKLRHA